MRSPLPSPRISIPDLRDYERINGELIRSLEAGLTRVTLAGAEGQRSLVAGITGGWKAIVEIEGQAGPELAARMDAPGLTVICHGSAAGGAGEALVAGQLVIQGDASEGLGYAQRGGTIVVAGAAGARAGLNQRGGEIVVLGPVGALAGERQAGGWFFAYENQIGPNAGRGRRGGRMLKLTSERTLAADADPEASAVFARIVRDLGAYLPERESHE